MKLKVLSYNIHKGYDWTNQKYFLEDMRNMINTSGSDLVFLQEVVGQNTKYQEKGLVDSQFEYLADSSWSHFSYARNAVYDHGHHGNLILSRYPIESWENVNISTNRFEKRGMLICKIRIPGLSQRYLHAICTHLDLLHFGRKNQYQQIRDKINEIDSDQVTPLILAGDFNDWNQKSDIVFEHQLNMKEAYKNRNGHFAKTFPAGWPILPLDRIYVRQAQVLDSKILARAKHQDHFSDHLPLYCELEI